MDKLCFLGNSETPQKLLDTFRKMTPGRTGIWGNLQGTGNIDEADYFAVIDKVPSEYVYRIKPDKCVILGAHPESLQSYQNMDSIIALSKFDCAKTIGFLEWWIKYDYDYLSSLQPMNKPKILGTIVSNSGSDRSHTMRKSFIERFCTNHNSILDVYGRIVPFGSIIPHYKGVCGQRANTVTSGDYWSGKEPVYEQYKYMLEFDNFGKYYFSERVLDCLLLWSMPIYNGGENIHEFIPQGSFRYFNINGNGEDVIRVIRDQTYEQNIDNIRMARNILLNHLQVWARVHSAIYGVNK
jgi:hypothetical protein